MRSETSMPTASQERNRRLFLKEYKDTSRPGDGLKRFVFAGVLPLAAGTVVDLGESWGAEKLMEKVFDGKIERLADTPTSTVPEMEAIDKKILETKSLKMGAAFVEEWASDSLYAAGMNAIVRRLTGVADATYVSEAAAFISEWANVISQVFGFEQRKGLPFWKKSENWLSGVNVEGGFRMLEELPLGMGKAVEWAHEKMDHLVTKSKMVKIGSTIAAKGITGYHIQKNMMGA